MQAEDDDSVHMGHLGFKGLLMNGQQEMKCGGGSSKETADSMRHSAQSKMNIRKTIQKILDTMDAGRNDQ